MAVGTPSIALIRGTAAGASGRPLSSGTTASAATASLSAVGGGRLIPQVLADIGTYYLDPVSVRRVAMAGAAQLSSLDNRLAVSEGAGAVALTYDSRTLVSYPAPA